jgi:hypothetical protein
MIYRVALAAVAVVAFAGSAQASQYGWCDVTGRNYTTYSTGIIEVEEGSDAYLAFRDGPWGQAFREYVNAQFGEDSYNVDCHAKNRLSDVKEWFGQTEYANKDRKFVRTGWTGDRPAAVDGCEKSSRPAKGLIIAGPGSTTKAEPAPGNSAAANQNRIKDEAEFARKHAEYEAAVAETKRKQEEYLRLEAERKALIEANAAKARAAQVEYQRRAAACKGGDYSQCGAPASAQ